MPTIVLLSAGAPRALDPPTLRWSHPGGLSSTTRWDQTLDQVTRIATQTAEKVGVNRALRSDEIAIVTGYAGPAYGVPDAGNVEAIHLVARTEGVITDPVYEGKSMAGLVGMIRSGEIPPGSRVLYAHLGGQPALPAYAGFPGLGSPDRELSH